LEPHLFHEHEVLSVSGERCGYQRQQSKDSKQGGGSTHSVLHVARRGAFQVPAATRGNRLRKDACKTVTEDDILRFAHESDPQPFHVDDAAARKTIPCGLSAAFQLRGAPVHDAALKNQCAGR
jgi:hypothetical protein